MQDTRPASSFPAWSKLVQVSVSYLPGVSCAVWAAVGVDVQDRYTNDLT